MSAVLKDHSHCELLKVAVSHPAVSPSLHMGWASGEPGEPSLPLASKLHVCPSELFPGVPLLGPLLLLLWGVCKVDREQGQPRLPQVGLALCLGAIGREQQGWEQEDKRGTIIDSLMYIQAWVQGYTCSTNTAVTLPFFLLLQGQRN